MANKFLDKDEVLVFYDRFGSKQDWQRIYEGVAFRELLRQGRFGEASSVFELGCGTGAFSLILLKEHLTASASYVGVDISSTMVGLAERKLARFPGQIFTVILCERAYPCQPLGSGGSGGIFTPSLFLGATLGGAYGLALAALFPGLPISPPAFALAGMAGMVGGVTGAAMTSIVMIFEMTLDYSVILPMAITVAISYGVRKMLSRESIYTQKLVRRGHNIPDSLRASMLHVKRAGDIMIKRFATLPASQRLEEFILQGNLKNKSVKYFLVEDADDIAGLFT